MIVFAVVYYTNNIHYSNKIDYTCIFSSRVGVLEHWSISEQLQGALLSKHCLEYAAGETAYYILYRERYGKRNVIKPNTQQ